MISESLAGSLGLDDGDTATVTSSAGEAALQIQKTDKLSARVVGATIHFPAVRKLFPWKLDEKTGEICLSPIQVKVTR
jgi:predicted molibdopterin-dependent oxidoreductase YjgC